MAIYQQGQETLSLLFLDREASLSQCRLVSILIIIAINQPKWKTERTVATACKNPHNPGLFGKTLFSTAERDKNKTLSDGGWQHSQHSHVNIIHRGN